MKVSLWSSISGSKKWLETVTNTLFVKLCFIYSFFSLFITRVLLQLEYCSGCSSVWKQWAWPWSAAHAIHPAKAAGFGHERLFYFAQLRKYNLQRWPSFNWPISVWWQNVKLNVLNIKEGATFFFFKSWHDANWVRWTCAKWWRLINYQSSIWKAEDEWGEEGWGNTGHSHRGVSYPLPPPQSNTDGLSAWALLLDGCAQGHIDGILAD